MDSSEGTSAASGQPIGDVPAGGIAEGATEKPFNENDGKVIENPVVEVSPAPPPTSPPPVAERETIIVDGVAASVPTTAVGLTPAEISAAGADAAELDLAAFGKTPLPPLVDYEPAPPPAPVPPPSIGRIVHYRAAHRGERPGGRDRHAALITAVNDDGSVELSVFPPGFNPMFISAANGSPSEELAYPGQWYWPPRV